MINRKVFFDCIRQCLFRGGLSAEQVYGINVILDHWELHYKTVSIFYMAYMLATVFKETGRRMVPVREGGGEAYLRSKRYYPWVGEGLVQVTWEVNARKFGAKKPGDCMSWPVALRALFEGMLLGMFTGKKLADYIKPTGARNYKLARRIINGDDCAAEIAAYAESFLTALRLASK
jgi:putative chitinase